MTASVTNLPTKPKAKASKKAGAKPGKATAKKAGQTAVAVSDLRNKAELAKDPKVAASALEAIAEIQKNWNKLVEAKALQKKQGFECKEKLEADEAALKAAIEEPVDQSPVEEKVKGSLKKLELVEMRWQEYEETKAGNVEIRKAAKDRVTNASEKLERSLKESAQLTLPHVTG